MRGAQAAAAPPETSQGPHDSATTRPRVPDRIWCREIHLAILLHIPVFERVRCCLVAKSWAALLQEPEFWADLSDFEGARGELLTADFVSGLCRRAAGRLRALCVPKAARRHDWLAELERLAAEGLTQRLERITSGAARGIHLPDEASARRLLAACPSLESVSATVDATWQEACAILRMLPAGDGTLRATLIVDARLPGPENGFVAFCDAVVAALGRTQLDALALRALDLETPVAAGQEPILVPLLLLYFRATEPPTEVAAAMERLAVALAHPVHGPREIDFTWRGLYENTGLGGLPALHARLWRELTPKSRLEKFKGTCHGGDVLEHPERRRLGALGSEWSQALSSLSEALASGRASRLSSLALNHSDIGEEGAVAIFSALATNNSLTALSLEKSFLGPKDGSLRAATALCAALRSNRTLMSLNLSWTKGLGSAGAELVLGAIGGDGGEVASDEARTASDAARGVCAVDELELSGQGLDWGREGLLGNLRRAATRLRELNFQYCGFDDRAAEEIASALRDPSCALESLCLAFYPMTDSAGVAIAAALLERAATSRLQWLTIHCDSSCDATLTVFGAVLAAQGACAAAREAAGTPGLSEMDFAVHEHVTLVGFRALARGVEAAGRWVKRVTISDADTGNGDFPADPDLKAEGVLLLREAAKANMAATPGRGVPIEIEVINADDP